jgi:CRISPR-associated endonuclease Csn1
MHEDTAWKPLAEGLARKRSRESFQEKRVAVVERKNLVEITEPNSQRHGFHADGSPRAYKGYVGGSNYALEIHEDEKGRWRGEVVSTFEAYQVVRKLGRVKGEERLLQKKYTLSGKPLRLRIMINDCLSLNVGSSTSVYRVATIRATGKVEFALHYEANVDARNRSKEDKFVYVSKTASSMQKLGARAVTVSPIGLIRKYRS